MVEAKGAQALSRKDFDPGNPVKWCPGCGSFAILSALQKCLAELGVAREKHVFVSGIGCSSRLPYYINTYGFHTIHGRAAAIATGVKLANPDLTVWVATGDGDALSIGGNHFVHCFRRNPSVKMLLFDNRIYGLTKGQASPTAPIGMVTKSTPFGSVEQPVEPLALGLAAGATFAARVLATDVLGMAQIFKAAVEHQGAALVQIMQNCLVFNDGAFDPLTRKDSRDDLQLVLRPGEPLVFGSEKEKGIGADRLGPVILNMRDREQAEGVLCHDTEDLALASTLARLPESKFPVPLGILYQVRRSTLEEGVYRQAAEAVRYQGKGHLAKLFGSGDAWEVR